MSALPTGRPAVPAGAWQRISGAHHVAFAEQLARLLAEMAQDAVSDLREAAPAAASPEVAAATPARQGLPPDAGDGPAELADGAAQAVAVAVVPALLPVPWVAPSVLQAVPSAPVVSPAGVTAAGSGQDADHAGQAPSDAPGATAAQASRAPQVQQAPGVSVVPDVSFGPSVPVVPSVPHPPQSGQVADVAPAAAAPLVLPAGHATLAPRPAASALPSAHAAPPDADATASVQAGVLSTLPRVPGVVAVAAQPPIAVAPPVPAVAADASAFRVLGGPVGGASGVHAAGANPQAAAMLRGVGAAGPAAIAPPLAQPPATLSWTGAVPASDMRLLVPLPSASQASGPAVAAASEPNSAVPVNDADPRLAMGWASGLGWLPAASHHSSAAAAVPAPTAAAAPAVPLPAQAGLPGQLQLQINLPDLGPLRLDMQLDASGQAQLLLQTGSAALAQTLGEHTHQLVDAMRELGLAVQVDVRHDGTATGGSAGSGGHAGGQQGAGQGGFQSASQGSNAHLHRQAQPTDVTPAPAATRPAPAHPDNALSYYA